MRRVNADCNGIAVSVAHAVAKVWGQGKLYPDFKAPGNTAARRDCNARIVNSVAAQTAAAVVHHVRVRQDLGQIIGNDEIIRRRVAVIGHG